MSETNAQPTKTHICEYVKLEFKAPNLSCYTTTEMKICYHCKTLKGIKKVREKKRLKKIDY